MSKLILKERRSKDRRNWPRRKVDSNSFNKWTYIGIGAFATCVAFGVFVIICRFMS